LYAVDKRDLKAWAKAGPFIAEFEGAEMLRVRFLTDPGVLAAVLPKPLKPPEHPMATAFVAHYPKTNFGVTYREGALFVAATYKDELGVYCLAMPVDDDMALIGGREQYGYPKKMAESISLERDGGHVVGSVIRKGEEILHIEVELTDEVDTESGEAWGMHRREDLDGRPCLQAVSFLFKFFPSASGEGFEHSPRLIRQPTLIRPRPDVMSGSGKLELRSTPADPLGEIPVREIIDTMYGHFDNTMLPGQAVATVSNILRFAPHAFFKTDLLGVIDPSTRPSRSRKQRRALEKKVDAY
jgi:acetoacetate decarboxylase